MSEAEYPSIIFRLCGECYEISSKRMEGIMQLPEFVTIPESPEYVRGVFKNRNEAIVLVDMRAFFSMRKIVEEQREFVEMIDARKNDHIHWVEELYRSVVEKKPFQLTTDPHRCAFGMWYDHYESDNVQITHHIRKIDEPHKALHKIAEEVERCLEHVNEQTREDCIAILFDQVRNEYMPILLRLLDETKQIFDDMYRELVLLVRGDDGRLVGLIVDEVVGVEELSNLQLEQKHENFYGNTALSGIHQRDNDKELIFSLDEKEIFQQLQAVNLNMGEALTH